MGILTAIFGSYSAKELARIEPIKNKVLELEEAYKALSDAELKEKTVEFKERVKEGESLDSILPEALATVREAGARVLGKRAFEVQIIGAIVLHQGRIAEMKTGEGKTLVACLAAYANALSGKGVHVVTVNDYLAKTQSEEMGKVHRFLGLTVGCILHGLTNGQRRKAYACDITYGTNNEFGFDYLRDNMVTYKKDMVQRAPNFAIVDEVDSILIDEARTPLIISGQGDKSTELYTLVDKFVKTLTPITVVEMDDKVDQEEISEDADYIIDEKAKTATITRRGVEKAEKHFHVENLMAQENLTLLHHINQALKAVGVMKNDIDYIVENDEVVIVDEFTGRKMLGRRFNDGLHQAIEAKEGVKVQRESKTLATITFQNYFRLYAKLSGMTGTAMTEEDEFKEIYKLDVIAIPTNRPVQRIDHSDQVYRSEKGKFLSIIDQIAECNKKGQPVLVGTVSIEKSELLSQLLKKRGIKHEVLNAKYHAKEAEIVAQAGKLGAVTIATNMAGRGTDIILGGNAEFTSRAELRKLQKPNGEQLYDDAIINEAIGFADTENPEILEAREVYRKLYEKYDAQVKESAVAVREAGGLYIIGTERHESRRIDNQLRGRSGRQGDPGESRFFLSVEDDLMRIFAGDRMENVMKSLNVEETQPIESKWLTKIIASSQKKVEGRNFSIRKNTLNYDDVMNAQREIIYKQRAQVLDGEDLHASILKMMEELVTSVTGQYLAEEDAQEDWNLVGLKDYFYGWLLEDGELVYSEEELLKQTKTSITEFLINKIKTKYAEKEQNYGEKIVRELERVVMLRVVDTKWMAHIDDMQELKRGISLRSYGQKNPVVEYRYEGFEMFDAMVDSIREETIRMLMTIQVQQNQAPQRQQVLRPNAPNAGSPEAKKNA
ncbi:MAG: preprotein translocase subunit SecA [Oscillospiraceae bacterium]|nr:preprotein translocase subunit SecA [Oscillospiraceae bacterium]MDE7094139.1 preprotein translocase subunit SecA [Oscillospiraceae bacterium]